MVWAHFKNEPERIPEVLNMNIKGKHPKERLRSKWGEKVTDGRKCMG
jgi:hypothetical protein